MKTRNSSYRISYRYADRSGYEDSFYDGETSIYAKDKKDAERKFFKKNKPLYENGKTNKYGYIILSVSKNH